MIEEGLGWGQVSEAFSGCRVDGPDDVVDVARPVVVQFGLSRQIASEDAVGVFDGAALPGLGG